MTMQTYGLTPARIERFKGATLKRAIAQECISKGGRSVKLPPNSSDTYVARRWLPYGGTSTSPNTFFDTTTEVDRGNAMVQAHQTSEGVTPLPESLTPIDYSVPMVQLSFLYGWTDKTATFYEDDIPAEAETIIGERITLINELFVFGALKAGTNHYYGGSGSSRATVNGGLTPNLLRKISRDLMRQHGRMNTKVLGPGPNYGSTAVAPGWIVYLSTDLESDARDLPGFQPFETYAAGNALPHEIGKWERFRFVTSPDFVAVLDGGADIGSTGLSSNIGTKIDVYQFIVAAEDAFSQVALRGASSMNMTLLPTGEKSKADAFGQRGYAGAMWWKATLIENQGWLAIANVGAKDL